MVFQVSQVRGLTFRTAEGPRSTSRKSAKRYCPYCFGRHSLLFIGVNAFSHPSFAGMEA